MTKQYPAEITSEIQSIAATLHNLMKNSSSNIRTLAKFSSMSINSVKAVLDGKTANIASYCLIAKALGTNLIDVIHGMKTASLQAATKV